MLDVSDDCEGGDGGSDVGETGDGGEVGDGGDESSDAETDTDVADTALDRMLMAIRAQSASKTRCLRDIPAALATGNVNGDDENIGCGYITCGWYRSNIHLPIAQRNNMSAAAGRRVKAEVAAAAAEAAEAPVRTKGRSVKGVAAFGAKRHRHLGYANGRRGGISRKSFGRIAYSGGSKRTSKKGLDALHDMTDTVFEKLVPCVLEITELSGRKTISEGDMHEALRRMGIHIYCYDVSRFASELRQMNARKSKVAAARKLAKKEQEAANDDDM